MTTQPTPVQLSVVPDAQTQKEIENTIDAPRRLSEAIEAFQKQRGDAQAARAELLAKELAAGPLNVARAIKEHETWKAGDNVLATKIKTAEELQPIIQKRIEELQRLVIGIGPHSNCPLTENAYRKVKGLPHRCCWERERLEEAC